MARFLRDLQKEFAPSNNNTTEKYNENELFTESTKNSNYKIEHFLNKSFKLKDYLSLLFGGPFSQIYYRIKKANGSLSHLWLLFPLFWIPPFSAIPLYYIAKNKLKKGRYPIKIIDMLGFAIAGLTFLNSILASQSKLMMIVGVLVKFVGTIALFIIRDKDKCSKKRILENGIYSATNLIILSVVLDLFFQYVMTNVPVLGLIIDSAYSTTIGNIVIKTILTLLSYYAVIMKNNTGKFCKKKNQQNLIIRIGLTLGSLLVSGLLSGGGGEEEEYYEEE